jgi:hypothetical protein
MENRSRKSPEGKVPANDECMRHVGVAKKVGSYIPWKGDSVDQEVDASDARNWVAHLIQWVEAIVCKSERHWSISWHWCTYYSVSTVTRCRIRHAHRVTY